MLILLSFLFVDRMEDGESHPSLALYLCKQREKIRKRVNTCAAKLSVPHKKLKHPKEEAPPVDGIKVPQQASPPPAVKKTVQDDNTIDLRSDSNDESDCTCGDVSAEKAVWAEATVVPKAGRSPCKFRTPNIPAVTTVSAEDTEAERSPFTCRSVLNPPRGHPLNPVVPKTIELLWQEVEDHYDRKRVDMLMCTGCDCPFASGPLMEQRYNLMQRLMVLEKLIWLGEK